MGSSILVAHWIAFHFLFADQPSSEVRSASYTRQVIESYPLGKAYGQLRSGISARERIASDAESLPPQVGDGCFSLCRIARTMLLSKLNKKIRAFEHDTARVFWATIVRKSRRNSLLLNVSLSERLS